MYPLSLQELGSDNTAYLDLVIILLSLIFYGPQLKEVKNCRNYKAYATFPYHFVSLQRKQIFSLVPSYYGLSLLRTLSLTPEGVRNNGSQLYTYTYDITSAHNFETNGVPQISFVLSPQTFKQSLILNNKNDLSDIRRCSPFYVTFLNQVNAAFCASHSFRASRKMPRSPRLAHKAPVIHATYTTTQIDNAKAVPLASQLCKLRARVLLALLSLRKNERLLVVYRNANCLTYFFSQKHYI